MKKRFTLCLITIIACLPMVFAVSSLVSETRKGLRQEKQCTMYNVRCTTGLSTMYEVRSTKWCTMYDCAREQSDRPGL